MKKSFKKHEILPDRIYNDSIISKFVNNVMKKGKKTTAQRIVYEALEIVKEKTKQEPLEAFKGAIKNAAPLLEVKPMRIGGATYQVPREVKGDKRVGLAMRWIIDGARAKKGKPMKEKLAQEIIDAFNNTGEAVRKKINIHKMAEANKAFAHFAR
ncbi:MAG: 30S ribosomal protein S7 [Candidatus Staskawiczbacteria bacterium CG10_big_fil_rev_8_21_14_0_10_38_10]|uniref:Small ribosomal subunit protein uS7 n=1 Tax=Candidatus Staskawiczbacteria bacterium CG10_big_fil_rev_8_21_14_0_10_38_10 TaxID=1974891 RepID=A0A2H9T224_9BACT|nr:MAG: 30S ribosomal protein S7 [Candidatus Staskawiczbacteria bacterium CG10_big_fil_rev_8_21_14_0_10_38_10]